MSLILGGGIYFFLKKEIITPKLTLKNQENETEHLLCLSESEQADFKIERLGKYPSVEYDKGFIEVVVKEVDTYKETSRFKIDNVINPSHYHPAEIHKCGVYVIRVFNYDPSKTKQDPGYKNELWKYDYNGNGKPIILFSEKSKEFISYYSPDFRIDPNENFLVLEKAYLGRKDYSLVIKNLNNKENIFVLSAKEITEQHQNIVGNFNMREWTKDSRYFWGDIFVGAYVKGFFRIDTFNWKTDIFEAPEGVGGGDALNTEKGLVTRHPGYVWTGLDILTEEIKKEWRKQGKKSTLYLYNLFTKEQILLETTDEPLWFFKPKWLSDTELQYELPTGEKKIYRVKE